MLIIPLTGLVSKACLRLSGGVTHGLDTLQHALKQEAPKGKGVLTREHADLVLCLPSSAKSMGYACCIVSNHISV